MMSDLNVMIFLTEVLNFTNVSKISFLIDLTEVISMTDEEFKKAEELTVMILKRVVAERMSESERSCSLCREKLRKICNFLFSSKLSKSK